ncbi:hypothetical protein IQ228_09490 [Dolichospermum sp. LEGE 00246]|nr:hypothetical protein [Dolichospermum sp. LEGE 00246]
MNCDSAMKTTKTIDTSITLPIELYQALFQQAQAHGYSVSDEITALLTPSLMQIPTELVQEFAAWETASDEDWLSMEATLASLDAVAVSHEVEN